MNGPYHDPNNLDTNGLNVSENVDFRPWAVGNPAIDNLDHVLALTITSTGSVNNVTSISPIPFEVDFSEAVQNFDKDTEISIIGDYLNDPVTINSDLIFGDFKSRNYVAKKKNFAEQTAPSYLR